MYDSIPHFPATYTDGNLANVAPSTQPKILILGTAAYGRTDADWKVTQIAGAEKEFKTTGSLIRGLYEVAAQGANNIFLRRLPTGTPAILAHLGSEAAGDHDGITITTVQEDAEAGSRYAIWYDAANERVAIYDNDAEAWIYDSDNILAEDTGLISVSGSFNPAATLDIGTEAVPVNLEDVVALVDIAFPLPANSDIEFTAGTDGEAPSLMQLYEALHEVYADLEASNYDFIVPMEATLDALNVIDLTAGEITTLGLDALTDYPVAGSSTDALGKVFVQEYLGQFYFWWDMDDDGTAEIFPSVGSADATHDIDGTVLTVSDFNEVNFAHQLAMAAYKASITMSSSIGFIGVNKPDGFDRASLANWIGELPTYTEESDGTIIVAGAGDNGSGLLGNKFMAGKFGFRDGLKFGGFFATDTEFPDGTEEEDDNDVLIDIGKHINVTYAWLLQVNQYIAPSNQTGSARPYVASAATTLAGKYAVLKENQEANGFNGQLKNVKMDTMKLIPLRHINELLSVRYVGVRKEDSVGAMVTGSRTGALPTSDYTKISTIRVANRLIKGIRALGLTVQGEPTSELEIRALENQISTFLASEVSLRMCGKASASLSYTAASLQLGQITCDVQFRPPNSLETIKIRMSVLPAE